MTTSQTGSVRAVGVVLSAMVLLGWAAIAAPQADAYARTGARWPSSTIRSSITQSYGLGSAWSTGRQRWNSTNTPIIFTNVAPSGGNRADLFDVNLNNVTWDGLANWTPGTGTITSATGRLNYYFLRNYDADKKAGVAAHELGHILGLAHAGGCVLMNGTSSSRDTCGSGGANSPQVDDKNGANAIY